MALQSQLFRGDVKLEAAATSDPAHIAPGASGEHVRKIQQALIQLDGAAISQDGVYGPKTAAAALAYKKKRNIVNRSYQTEADNIVGKMTIAALDREMLGKEPQPSKLLSPCCVRGPERAPRSDLLLAFGVADSGPSVNPRDKALESAKIAKVWIGRTLSGLQTVGNKLRTGLTADLRALETMDEFQILEKNFHLSRGGMGDLPLFGALPGLPAPARTTAVSGVLTLSAIYMTIQRIIARAEEFYKSVPQPKSDPRVPAQTPDQGAFQRPGDPSVKQEIQIFPAFINMSEAKSRPFVLIHEASHFAFPFIDHFAFAPMIDGPEGPPYKFDTQGTKPRSKQYLQLNFLESVQNADCFSQCALQMVFGKDFLKSSQEDD